MLPAIARVTVVLAGRWPRHESGEMPNAGQSAPTKRPICLGHGPRFGQLPQHRLGQCPSIPARSSSVIIGILIDSVCSRAGWYPRRRLGAVAQSGSAPRSHRGGQGFKSPQLHQFPPRSEAVPLSLRSRQSDRLVRKRSGTIPSVQCGHDMCRALSLTDDLWLEVENRLPSERREARCVPAWRTSTACIHAGQQPKAG
jgi:hypothetical protein